MDNSFVCPSFGIGLALNDKDITADKVASSFQNFFCPAPPDAKLRAIGDQTRLQVCRQGVFVVGADLLLLGIEQFVVGIESQEY